MEIQSPTGKPTKCICVLNGLEEAEFCLIIHVALHGEGETVPEKIDKDDGDGESRITRSKYIGSIREGIARETTTGF